MTDPVFDPTTEAPAVDGDEPQSPDAVAMALAVPLDADADPGPRDDDPVDDDPDDDAGGAQ